jgi:hypothetical protein
MPDPNCPVHGLRPQQPPASAPNEAFRASAGGPSFVGEWRCQFYNLLEKLLPDGRILLPADTIIPPEPFPVTIYRTPQGRLEGYYPNPPGIGFAGLYGNTTNNGKVWNGVFFPANSPPGLVSGQFLFVLADDGRTFHGAWTGKDADGVYPAGAPQPWWGTRVG